MCRFTLKPQKMCICCLDWAVTEGREMSPEAFCQQSSLGQLHFHERQALKPEVAVSSVFFISCKHFIKEAAQQNPTESGLSAREWQQQHGCRGDMREAAFSIPRSLLSSPCVCISPVSTARLHTSPPWPGYMTGELTSPSWCVCVCVCLYFLKHL